jgi:hypothetical protein
MTRSRNTGIATVSGDDLARALKNADLAHALSRNPDDLFHEIAERLQIPTAYARRVAAAA